MLVCFFSQLRWVLVPAVGLGLLAACSSTDTTRATPGVSVSPNGIVVDSAGEVPEAIVGTLQQDALAAGQAIFTQRCAACHGEDGRKGANGAHDLTKSNLNTTGRIYMVKNGLGKMPGFKDQLSDAEIEQVVAYSLTLK
ncbi:cytochrome c [Hymenobacter aerilatus]|uniref:Cytochrome c n=1 Tax=Hymenobacter aerilatus TaxID=2932251 RepID=A0A8T9SZH2_9BACT|nr:cytochrome c [Hymenobacter aerilatus]UOR05159.1 cytochrome c [Hymenobacter aerilatus]